jgi:CheY-like chemotaxis protein
MLPSDKINFERIQFLVVDNNHHSLNLTTAVVAGFGAQGILKCTTVAEARDIVCGNPIDFLLISAQMPDEDGYAFVRWLRRKAPEVNRFIPVIALSGHTRRSQVFAARDCGVQAVITKPLVPKVLLERAFWVAHDDRRYIECDEYVGPDRRFQNLGPPEGIEGRRDEDRQAAAEASSIEVEHEAAEQLKAAQ